MVSVVKQSHYDKEFLNLKEVEKLLSNKEFKKNKNKKCRIKVDIVGVLETDASKVIKVLDTKNNKILDYEKPNKKKGKESDKKIVINLVFLVKDSSMKKNQTMNLYLTSKADSD